MKRKPKDQPAAAPKPDPGELVEVELPDPKPERKSKACTVSGCDKPHRARGLCSTHYNEQRDREEPAAAEPAEEPAATPAAKKPEGWKVALGAVLGVAIVGALGGAALYLSRSRNGHAQILHFPKRGEA